MFRSQQTWAKANQEGWFNDEMAPVEVKTKKGPGLMTADEHPKPQVTLEALAKLPTVFKKGTRKYQKYSFKKLLVNSNREFFQVVLSQQGQPLEFATERELSLSRLRRQWRSTILSLWQE
jgi:acetyl-CoA acetyltransferase